MALTRQEEARNLRTRRVRHGLANRGYKVVPISGSIRDGDQTFRVTGPGGNSEILTLDEAYGLLSELALEEVQAKTEAEDRLGSLYDPPIEQQRDAG
jgi:hypothetical protein